MKSEESTKLLIQAMNDYLEFPCLKILSVMVDQEKTLDNLNNLLLLDLIMKLKKARMGNP